MFDESTLFGPFAEIDRLDLPETHRSAPFEGLLGTFYTKIVTRATEDSAWFAEHVGEPRPTGVLDLCCGGGRSVLEFARKGWQVTGVDRSRTQLASARDLLAGAGPDVTSRVSLVREDVFSVDLGRAFDVRTRAGLAAAAGG